MRFDGIEMNGPLLGKQGANLASASTVDLATATGNSLTITGTTSITALGTVQAGAVFVLTFAGALTLTHSSDLQLPNDADLTVASGQVIEFTSLGAGAWKCTGIQWNYIPQNEASRSNAPESSWGVSQGYPTTQAITEYSGLSITRADLITLRDGPGMAINQEFIITDSTPIELMVKAIGTGGPGGIALTAIRYSASAPIVIGEYDLDTDTFTPLPSPAYTTISLASWTALVAASGLVPGTFYRVTAAYTSVLFATDFDIEVLATSANTVSENCVIYYAGPPDDGFTSTDGAFTFARIASASFNGNYIAGAAITTNNASPINFQPGSWVYINDSSSYKLKANVGSDGVISVENVLCIDPASPQYNLIGIYDVATDVLIPQTIRTQRIALSTSDIQAGTAIPLSQFPAISGSYWNVTNVIVALTAGATPYTTTLLIQANGATNDQWRYALTSATHEKVLITDRRTNGDCFPDNAGMEIQFSGSDFSGDGSAIVWVTSELLTT